MKTRYYKVFDNRVLLQKGVVERVFVSNGQTRAMQPDFGFGPATSLSRAVGVGKLERQCWKADVRSRERLSEFGKVDAILREAARLTER